MNELKPCPFCGGEGVLADTFTENNKTWFCYVRCKECGASISDIASSEEEATNRVVKNWNTRYERTCYVAGYCTDENSNDVLELSCGHEAIQEFGAEPVGYCSNCGAKVVEE